MNLGHQAHDVHIATTLPIFAKLQGKIDAGLLEEPVREFVDFEYQTLKSWSCKRRVVGKAEILEKGHNPHFVVTNFDCDSFDARALYEACGKCAFVARKRTYRVFNQSVP